MGADYPEKNQAAQYTVSCPFFSYYGVFDQTSSRAVDDGKDEE